MATVKFAKNTNNKISLVNISNKLSRDIWKLVSKMSNYGKFCIGHKIEKQIYVIRHAIVDANHFELEDRIKEIDKIRLMKKHLSSDLDYVMSELDAMNVKQSHVYALALTLREMDGQLCKWKKWAKDELRKKKKVHEIEDLPF